MPTFPRSCCKPRARRRRSSALPTGGDTTNAIKQAADAASLPAGRSSLQACAVLTDGHALGLRSRRVLNFTETFFGTDDQPAPSTALQRAVQEEPADRCRQASYSSLIINFRRWKALGAIRMTAKIVARVRKCRPTILCWQGCRSDADRPQDPPAYLSRGKKPQRFEISR